MSKAHGYLPSQKEAVYFDKNYLLILAGAGTGKTLSLIHISEPTRLV